MKFESLGIILSDSSILPPKSLALLCKPLVIYKMNNPFFFFRNWQIFVARQFNEHASLRGIWFALGARLSGDQRLFPILCLWVPFSGAQGFMILQHEKMDSSHLANCLVQECWIVFWGSHTWQYLGIASHTALDILISKFSLISSLLHPSL